MNSSNIKNLINYAYEHLNLNELDELYVRNRLLEACFMEEYDEDSVEDLIEVKGLDFPDPIINPILDELISSGKMTSFGKSFSFIK